MITYNGVSYWLHECLRNDGQVYEVYRNDEAELPWLVVCDGVKKPYKTKDAAYLCLYCLQRPRRPSLCPVTATSQN